MLLAVARHRYEEDEDDDDEVGEDRRAVIILQLIRLEYEVESAAAALKKSRTPSIVFNFDDSGDRFRSRGVDYNLNWQPLLDELAAHAWIKEVTMEGSPTGRLLPLLRDEFFPALQRNQHIQALFLGGGLRLSLVIRNPPGGDLISFLAESRTLTGLGLADLHGDCDAAAAALAAEVRRNKRLENLCLYHCVDGDVARQIFQGLSSGPSSSQLRELVLGPHPLVDSDQSLKDSVDVAVGRYLQSDACTLSCLSLQGLKFTPDLGGSQILIGLTKNNKIHQVGFFGCGFDGVPGCDGPFVNFLRDKANLEVLRMEVGDLFDRDSVRAEFSKRLSRSGRPLRFMPKNLLSRSGTPLRSLTLDLSAFFDSEKLPNPNGMEKRAHALSDILTAISKCAELESLSLSCSEPYRGDYIRSLIIDSVPSLTVKNFTLDFKSDLVERDDLLHALKKNLNFQTANLEKAATMNWMRSKSPQIDRYLERNRNMVEWREDPGVLPRALWPYALTLSSNAGTSSLYKSLLQLAKVGNTTRKRKHNEH
jgi:hypothetical protein